LDINPKTSKEPLKTKVYSLDDDEEVIPNLVVKFEFEHIIGLLNLVLKIEEKRMRLTLDLINSVLQFENPNWCYFSDYKEEQSITKRFKVFDVLSKPNSIFAKSNFLEEFFIFEKARKNQKKI